VQAVIWCKEAILLAAACRNKSDVPSLCMPQAQLRVALGLPEIKYPVPAPPSTAPALPPSTSGGDGGISGAVVGGIVAGVVVIVGLLAAVLGERPLQPLMCWAGMVICTPCAVSCRQVVTSSIGPLTFVASVQRSSCRARGSGSGKRRRRRSGWRAPPAAPAWTARASGGATTTPLSRSVRLWVADSAPSRHAVASVHVQDVQHRRRWSGTTSSQLLCQWLSRRHLRRHSELTSLPQ
jgi:hypothetical protein